MRKQGSTVGSLQQVVGIQDDLCAGAGRNQPVCIRIVAFQQARVEINIFGFEKDLVLRDHHFDGWLVLNDPREFHQAFSGNDDIVGFFQL
ncbi:hypothetical protein SDC9_206152 [bioreactor metagenome]|uniref:Uncharacterized protein n=1 Tax=bioreactor metagenome TaxID=1076179 RepID=A0A645J4Y1_9ZZZZ